MSHELISLSIQCCIVGFAMLVSQILAHDGVCLSLDRETMPRDASQLLGIVVPFRPRYIGTELYGKNTELTDGAWDSSSR